MPEDILVPTFVGTVNSGIEVMSTTLVDSGCGKTLIGEETLVQLEQMLHDKGPWRAVRYDDRNSFRFGNGAVEESKISARIPVGLSGAYGVIDAAVISGAAPLLLGRPTLEKLSVKLDFEHNQMQFLNFKADVKTNQAGQLLIDILQFP